VCTTWTRRWSTYTRLSSGLTSPAGSATAAFLTGPGLEHHWIRLEEGPTEGRSRSPTSSTARADLLEIRGRLVATGIAVDEGGDVHHDRVQRWRRFVDPGGMHVEVFVGMVERGVDADEIPASR